MEDMLQQTEEALQQADHIRALELNRKFHTILYKASRQRRLYEQIINHLDLSELYRRMYFIVEHLHANTTAEHKELLEILRQGDAEGAEQHSRINLQQTASTLISFLRETH
jgi:DNA-binding GntR family transcriptional regulator